MIVLDASVLIAHLDARDRHHSRAVAMLNANPAQDLAASTLTIAEVLTGPARAGTLDRAIAAIARLGVISLPITERSTSRLALLRAESRVKMPDCCVLLAAEESGAMVATFDLHLAGVARERGISLIEP